MIHASGRVPLWWVAAVEAAANGPNPYPSDIDEAIKTSLIGFTEFGAET